MRPPPSGSRSALCRQAFDQERRQATDEDRPWILLVPDDLRHFVAADREGDLAGLRIDDPDVAAQRIERSRFRCNGCAAKRTADSIPMLLSLEDGDHFRRSLFTDDCALIQ